MTMTLNKTHWEWYKESVQGQTAIESFSNREDFMDDVRLLEYIQRIKEQIKIIDYVRIFKYLVPNIWNITNNLVLQDLGNDKRCG